MFTFYKERKNIPVSIVGGAMLVLTVLSLLCWSFITISGVPTKTFLIETEDRVGGERRVSFKYLVHYNYD